MPLLHFQDLFAEAVRNGTKTQTIRTERKRPINVGDRLVLGRWIGSPYRSKVERLRTATCTHVEQIAIGIGPFGDEIEVDGKRLKTPERAALARADGFSTAGAMVAWFRTTHGLPFVGVIIHWGEETLQCDYGLKTHDCEYFDTTLVLRGHEPGKPPIELWRGTIEELAQALVKGQPNGSRTLTTNHWPLTTI